jgi:hypothetical protein
MRLERQLLLLAVAGSIAVSAAPAARAGGSETEPLAMPASTGVSVTAEPAGTACSSISPATPPASGTYATSGGCLFHVGGPNIVVSGHLFGIEVTDSTCNFEFDYRIDWIGRVTAVHQELTQGTQGTCTRRPCHYPLTPGTEEPPSTGQTESRPWRGYLGAAPAPLFVVSTLLICLEDRHTVTPEQNKRHINISIPGTESSNHRYTFAANDVNGSTSSSGVRAEVSGIITTEATQVAGSESGRTQVEINRVP